MAYHLDPYPALAQLRREEPVHRSKELNAWVLTAYETCNRVLHDDDTFSSDPIHAGGEMGASIAATRAAVPLGAAPIMGNSDDPVHARIRTIVNRAFVPRVISAIEPRLEDIAGRILDDVPEGPVELMSAFVEPFVVLSVLEQLGIPADDRGTFRAGAQAILAARSEGPSRIQAASEAHNLMTAMLGRWQQSGDVAETSVLGTLLHAADDERLSPDEMLMTLIHIASAGNGPTAFAIGNAVLAIGQHREALARLMEGPEHLPSAVEEALRFDSPTHMISRFARRDADLGGRKIRAGDMAYVVIGAANRDPDRFPDADTFDTARTDNRHLSFGIATHFCLGAPLARLMIATALSAVMGSFGRYRLLEAQRGGTLLLRGPGKLVITPE
jgi:cytochrome P450